MSGGLIQLPTSGPGVTGTTIAVDANTALLANATLQAQAGWPTPSSLGTTGMAGIIAHNTTTNQIAVRDQADTTWILIGFIDEVGKNFVPYYNGGALPPPADRNRLANGGCEITTRSTAPSLSTTMQYGLVDLIAAFASGTAISAGTITQDTAAPIGLTGKALKIAGVTITGAGVVYTRYRLESNEAVKLKNQNASYSTLVEHDVAAGVNYTIVIRKPTAKDNFTSTTTIVTSSAVPVAQSTPAQLTFAGQAMGDVSFGIEIEVQAACGAVSANNFWQTEFQLEQGVGVTAFERRPIAVEQEACGRRCRWVSSTSFFVAAGAGQVNITPISWPVMRAVPSVGSFTSDPNLSQTITNVSTDVLNYAAPYGGAVQLASTAAGNVQFYGYRALLTAEL